MASEAERSGARDRPVVRVDEREQDPIRAADDRAGDEDREDRRRLRRRAPARRVRIGSRRRQDTRPIHAAPGDGPAGAVGEPCGPQAAATRARQSVASASGAPARGPGMPCRERSRGSRKAAPGGLESASALPGGPVTRFQRLAAATVATTFLLVVIGVVVRATDSGLACPHWPGCFEGQFLPGLDAGFQVWIEWIHRTVAALIGVLILGMAALACRGPPRPALDPAGRRWPPCCSSGSRRGSGARRSGSGTPASPSRRTSRPRWRSSGCSSTSSSGRRIRRGSPGGGSQRFTLLAAFGAAATFAVLLFGANVTARDAGLVFPDWPLMNGSLVPGRRNPRAAPRSTSRRCTAPTRCTATWPPWSSRFSRPWPGWPGATAPRSRAWRGSPSRSSRSYVVQVVVGALQIATLLAPWTQTLHVALGALLWGGAVALAVGRVLRGADGAAGRRAPGDGAPTGEPTAGEPPRARHAPASATRSAPTSRSRSPGSSSCCSSRPSRRWSSRPARSRACRWPTGRGSRSGRSLCGTLAAGSANAINQYLERDIDAHMARTRRRPLPAHAVTPGARGRRSGSCSGRSRSALMAWTVNVLAAFLTLLAIAFYVVVYTIMLKRSTPQNIVIGGAAGALPPVIGWAAVTGDVGAAGAAPVPRRLLLDAAPLLGARPPDPRRLRRRRRADAPGRPGHRRDEPPDRAVHDPPRGAHRRVRRRGPDGRAVPRRRGGARGRFLWRAYVLWRQGTAPEESTAQAIRLYRYSITYLTVLFAAVALDTVVRVQL